MTPFNTDIYTADGAVDLRKVEQNAQRLRAEATRDAFQALIAFFKPKAADAKGTQNA